jgi:hypothetical protein
MKKFLKAIRVLQEVSNKGREPKLGQGYFTARRLNPYNPLSYLTVVIFFIVGIISYGVIGFWKEADHNPFEWD